MYGRLGSTDGGFGPNPMAQVFIQSAILYVPDKCVVNEGQLINVEFGEIGGSDPTARTTRKAFRCASSARAAASRTVR